MRRAIGMAAVLLFVGATTAFGQAAMSGNSHDFSSTHPTGAYYGVDLTSTNYGDQICVVCHAPHNVEATYEATYLWNRRGTTVTTYSMYSSNTIDGTIDPSPATESKMCLSCHDGTIGLEDFNGTTGGTTRIVDDSVRTGVVAATNLDLSREHPISLTYDVTDTGLIAVVTAEGNGVNLYTDGGPARVECGSCHDPHLQNITAEATEDYFLRVDNDQSALCTTCHDK